jgi:hypothetical protein
MRRVVVVWHRGCRPVRGGGSQQAKLTHMLRGSALISHMAPTTTTHKVFETPELFGLVCSHATLETCALILRSNKIGFHCAVPYVWNEIDVVDLLMLIPGTSFRSDGQRLVG